MLISFRNVFLLICCTMPPADNPIQFTDGRLILFMDISGSEKSAANLYELKEG